ncbi:MAG: hypothetical protein JWP12_3350 [Bacteroidetes bacterium]|nr:hypothetical protein [Bacteroidota bacterium]
MKKLVLILSCAFTVSAFAQSTVNITTSQYATQKQAGTLDHTKNYFFTDAPVTGTTVHYTGGERSPSTICSCMVTLDSTFTVAMAPNDDGSTPLISIPFAFNMYGVNYSSLYINNNGNISFGTTYSTFTANAFPDSAFQMVAPFWADVDTRGTGAVYYKITPTSMIVKWEAVGYYSTMTDKVNTFQLVITDGTDPILPTGTNVSFCYGDMQWTTGAASSGINGFNGVPATVGINQGNGTDYFQVGRFDTAGVAFDGPYNTNDQVDWLDNQGMYFNTAITGNVPPVIINNNICDTIDVYTGDTTRSTSYDVAHFVLGASTPEIGQTVTALLSSDEPGAFTFTKTMNDPTYQQFDCEFSAVGLPEGIYHVTITATDNGIPARSTTRTIVIRTHYDASVATGIAEINPANSLSVYPNPSTGNITIKHSYSLTSNPVVTMVDVLGKTVLTTALISNQQTIDINALPQGIYFATITSKDGISKTMKIVRK